MSVSVLDREMFTEAEAARLLRVPQRTLNYWLEGGEVRGRAYRPVIRTEPRGGHAAVTWAEFVEAGLLREYRQTQTWEGDEAAAWRPHDDPLSPVLMRSGLRAGRPTVRGISTDILWEHEQSGETISEIAVECGLSDEDVRWAIAYETSARAA